MRRKIYKEDIIQAGMDLMYLKGYNATAIKDITDKVGIPKGSFYNHFKNKEEFGMAVLQYYADEHARKILRALSNSQLSPVDRMRSFFNKMAREFTKMDFRMGCLAGNMSQELADVHDAFGEALDRVFVRFKGYFLECLQDARKEGQIPPALDIDVMAEFITNSWQGAVVRMKASRNSYPLKSFNRILFDHLLASNMDAAPYLNSSDIAESQSPGEGIQTQST